MAMKGRTFYQSPPFSDFPKEEYQERIRKAKGYMEDKGVDLLVMWDKKNIRYFTGFHSSHWASPSIQPAVCLLPLESDPILIIPEFFQGVVEGLTYVDDIRVQKRPHYTNRIRQFPVKVADTIKSLRGVKTLGIEAGYLGGMSIPRPLNDIDLFRQELSAYTFIEAAQILWNCRMIKSSLEVEAMSQATKAIVEAHKELVSTFRLGMSEEEVGIVIKNAIVSLTHEIDALNIRCSSRRYPMPDTPPFYKDVPISLGDRMVIEPLTLFKGYRGTCARSYKVGPLTEDDHLAVKLIEEGQKAAISIIKPGIRPSLIIQEIQRVFAEEGDVFQFEMAGHGVGLVGHEPPMISLEEEISLQEGMVLAIEVWKYGIPGFAYDKGEQKKNTGPYANEDLVLVTKNGHQRLPAFRKDILSLPHHNS